jgi:hypothetical protein
METTQEKPFDHQMEDPDWNEILSSREVEQEVLNILDAAG